MAFCTHCGQQVADGAKFCANCGTPITQNISNTERKNVFDGEIHKCPNCGEVLNAFETVCPACNFELRGAKSSSAVKDLAEKLEHATSEKQRIIIVKNFPIPNTKEDIFEFMLLASSNFDASYYATHLHEEDISDAWLIKIEQCYQKAKLAFGSHSDFERIESVYLKIKNECAEKESKIKHEQKAQQSAKERAEEATLFKKSKLRIITIIFAIISALCIAVAFNDEKIAAGIIAIIMFASFVVAFLMGSGVIKEKIKNMRLIPTIVGFVLLIPYFALYAAGGIGGGGSTKWDDIMLNEYAPQPPMTSAEVMTNSREEFYIYDIKCSQREFYDYIDDCKEFGYDYEILEEDESSFEAYNSEGYKIKLTYILTLSVDLSTPMEMNSIEWPNSDIAKLIPQPQSLFGKISWQHDYGFVIYIGNTTLADYKEYVNLVYNSGFNVDYSKGDTHFWADNIDGYHVNITYEGFNTMFIRIDEPDEN